MALDRSDKEYRLAAFNRIHPELDRKFGLIAGVQVLARHSGILIQPLGAGDAEFASDCHAFVAL